MWPRDSNRTVAESIASTTALDRLASEWSALWQRCERATPFQSPAWVLPWISRFHSGPLHAIALRDAATGRLVALALCYISVDSDGDRTLQFTGTGVSDYNDVLVEPGFESELVAAIETANDGEAGPRVWDHADLQQLPSWSPLARATLTCDFCSACELHEQVPCPVIALAGERENWFPAGWRHKLDYDRRRLARTAQIEFLRSDTSTLREHFTTLVRLHSARWEGKGGGALADPAIRAFHAEAALALLTAGMLRFYVLRVGGAIVACYYGFLAHRRAYYYLGGFDPRWDRFGIGNLLVEHAILEAAREGAAVFDFLRGQESYKYRWGAQDEPTFRLNLVARTPATPSGKLQASHA